MPAASGICAADYTPISTFLNVLPLLPLGKLVGRRHPLGVRGYAFRFEVSYVKIYEWWRRHGRN